jgi:pimeloyl-ACP methyl ester carboxylesterase
MARIPTDDRLLELDDGRTIGYATWGDPEGAPVFIGHGTPGARLDRYPGLEDPEWVHGQRLLFVGVDRPGYGYSDPCPEASLLDCAGDFVRVADDLGLERFAALGVSGGAPYVIALGALAPERVVRIAVVSGADVGMDEEETPEELAAEVGQEAQILRDDPDEWYAGFVAEVTEVDRRVLERPEVRATAIEMFQEAVRQGAVGWVDDVVRLGRPWPFRLDEVLADIRFHHGEEDANVPPQHAKELAERIPTSRLRLYPGEGHISILDRHNKEIVETLLAPSWYAAVYESGVLRHAIQRSAWKGYSPKFAMTEFREVVESRSALGESLRHRSCTPQHPQPRFLGVWFAPRVRLRASLPQSSGEAPILGLAHQCELTLAEGLCRVGLVHRSCLLGSWALVPPQYSRGAGHAHRAKVRTSSRP